MRYIKTLVGSLAMVAVLCMAANADAAALSAAKYMLSKNTGNAKRYLMTVSETVYKGGMVMVTSAGTAQAAAAAASNNGVVGIATETVTAAASGDTYVTVIEGWFLMAGTTLEQEDVGEMVYAETDQEVDETAGANEPVAGLLIEYVSASSGWVHISPIYQARDSITDDPITLTGDLTAGGGAGAVTFTDSASSIVIPDNDASALDIGAAGVTTMMRFSSETGKETVTFANGVTYAPVSVTAAVTLDESNCGQTHLVTAAADGDDITLPATIAGCVLEFIYVGADDGCDLDLVVNASDGIHGSCTVAAAVTEYSGTDDADIRLSKATSNTGDRMTIVGDGDVGWFISDCAGIWVNF